MRRIAIYTGSVLTLVVTGVLFHRAGVFDPSLFMPRAHCMNFDPVLYLSYAATNLAIFLAYMVIPYPLLKMARALKVYDAIKTSLYLFAAFIWCCGVGHLVDVVMVWYPVYMFQVIWHWATATISIVTALYVIPSLKGLVNGQ